MGVFSKLCFAAAAAPALAAQPPAAAKFLKTDAVATKKTDAVAQKEAVPEQAGSNTEDVDSKFVTQKLVCNPTCGADEFCSDPVAAHEMHEHAAGGDQGDDGFDVEKACPECAPLSQAYEQSCQELHKGEKECMGDVLAHGKEGEVGKKMMEKGKTEAELQTCRACIQGAMDKHSKGGKGADGAATTPAVMLARFMKVKKTDQPHCVTRLHEGEECGFHAGHLYERSICLDGLRCHRTGDAPEGGAESYATGDHQGGPATCQKCAPPTGAAFFQKEGDAPLPSYIAPKDQDECHHDTKEHGWMPNMVQGVLPNVICVGCDYQDNVNVVEAHKSTMCVTTHLSGVQCPDGSAPKSSTNDQPECQVLSEAEPGLERQLTESETRTVEGEMQRFTAMHADYQAGMRTCGGDPALNVPVPPGTLADMRNGKAGKEFPKEPTKKPAPAPKPAPPAPKPAPPAPKPAPPAPKPAPPAPKTEKLPPQKSTGETAGTDNANLKEKFNDAESGADEK